METSILKTIRQMIGPSASYDVFDTDLIVHINSTFSRLCQLGVGSVISPFKITGESETWDDFINWNGPNNESDTIVSATLSNIIDDVKQYIALKVRMLFDTPASGTVANALQAQIDQQEWLLKEVARFGY
jgi:hypothetical protein